MKYYPIHLDIKNKKCLVVGGGHVGARKAATLFKAGATVRVISREFSELFFRPPLKRAVERVEREYRRSDLEGVSLVISATDHKRLNQRIAVEAKEHKVLCNIADSPDASDFILPSIVHRGDLLLTISTSGSSPALAKKLRRQLENDFGDEYSRFLIFMGRLRKMMLDRYHDPKFHALIFRELVDASLLEKMAQNDAIAFGKTLKAVFLLASFTHTEKNLTPFLSTKKLRPIYEDLFPTDSFDALPLEASQ